MGQVSGNLVSRLMWGMYSLLEGGYGVLGYKSKKRDVSGRWWEEEDARKRERERERKREKSKFILIVFHTNSLLAQENLTQKRTCCPKNSAKLEVFLIHFRHPK